MANPMLPIADSPETIDISTRIEVFCQPREGGPNVHGTGSSGLRVFNQMNVNHDHRVIIDQQHFVQNNKVLIQTHDPAYTEMLEQTAEARHRMAIAEAEAQANHRHEA